MQTSHMKVWEYYQITYVWIDCGCKFYKVSESLHSITYTDQQPKMYVKNLEPYFLGGCV